MHNLSEQELRDRLAHLEIEHRDLDEAIRHMARDPQADQLTLRRLKKRKLHLKDLMTRIESMLIPDLDA